MDLPPATLGPPFRRRSWRRRLLRLGGGVAFCYGGLIVVLLALENWLLYRPVPHTKDWQPPPPGIRAEDVELFTPDGTLVHAWWCPTENWEPSQGAVLYCHGNAGNLSHRGESISRWQRAMGQAVLIFDYPGYGKSGGKPGEAGCYAAAAAAYDWLVGQKGVPPDRLLLYGGSLGGGVAVELARQKPHRALVLVSAFTSVPDMAQKQYPFLPGRWLVRNKFDNLAKMGQLTRPVFIAHGTADRLVPFAMGRRLYDAAPGPHKAFFPMEGYDHNHTPGPDFYARLRDFLAKAEQPAPAAAPD